MALTRYQQIIEAYFTEPSRQVDIASGQSVLTQNGHNDRLYFVVEGELHGFYQDEESQQQIQVFTASKGAFIGVHSFFSETYLASSTVIAKSDCVLAWIDNSTQAIEPEKHGPLSAQFTPIIVNELSQRQRRATQETIAKERALKQLHTAEQMTTLGQLAAGIAHELNNAVGVLSSKTERLLNVILELLEENNNQASEFVDQGLLWGQKTSSADVRVRAKELVKEYGLDRDQAKAIARAIPQGDVSRGWLDNTEQAIRFWNIGRDLHDMRIAAKHSVSIVKSVKQLGRTDVETKEWVDINDSLRKSLALLQSDLRRVSVHFSPAELPKFVGSETELVQIWANIIKNACDAMSDTESPQIDIVSRFSSNKFMVAISNNGPEIPEVIRRQVFQPNFTTKKGGLSFGLGLGLSIVKRIVSSYEGSVVVKSSPDKTVFRIKLPNEEGYGKA
ncbi:ATP-binding protein [Vibrio tapetis]|uniref:histidine kinase n=1 Tax=Vibrio tapetis subsp. tapetis TaxID=1671868 RepID=A0A2N8ZCV2_9VIBR|nr:ATP-binding protein [Vibrio tapetis]SON49730.1 Sensory transduction protein kinase [Vibrio tapetis subsp. tapetis]